MSLPIRLLTVANIAVSLVVWIPAWAKILRTRSARDYSMATLLMIQFLQFSSLAVAVLEHAIAMAVYIAVNSIIVLATCALVWRFRNGVPDGE
jgi:hypothetical protein